MNESAIRNLRAKKISFDGYGNYAVGHARDSPFFGGPRKIVVGNKTLRIEQKDNNTISLKFEDVCTTRQLVFLSCTLTFDQYLQKLKEACRMDRDCIWLEIDVMRAKSCNCSRCYSYGHGECDALSKAFVEENKLSFMAAVQFDLDEVRNALAIYDGITPALTTHTTTNKQNKETTGGNTMNVLGLNFKIGMNKDPNVTATPWGIAVRKNPGDDWHSYDINTRDWRNLTKKDLCKFPVMFFPKRKEQIVPGDVIQNGDDWITIKEVTSEGTFKAVSNLTGLEIEAHPEVSLIAGLSFYTTAVSIMNLTNMTATNGQNVMGGFLGTMVMLKMLKPKKEKKRSANYSYDSLTKEIVEDNDTFGGLGEYWPLIFASNSQAIQDSPFLSLMMMSDSNGDDDDQSGMLEMLLASQFLGGGNNGGNASNPFAAFGMGVSPAGVTASEKVCAQCGAKLPSDAVFCSKCGGKAIDAKPVSETTAKCHNCGAELQPGAKFCNACGANVEAPTCPNCGKKLRPGAKFCDQCGASTTPPKCPKCGKELAFGAKFCDQCGAPLTSDPQTLAPTTAKCPKCGAEQPPEATFCSECGAKMKPEPATAAPAKVET